MRGAVVLVVGCLALARAHVGAEPDEDRRGPPRWQAASGASSITRMWGSGSELYGVGARGAYHSSDRGATWSPVDGAGPANGVWGTGTDDVWIIRARTIHHASDGVHWSTQTLPMLSLGASLEGMWGVDRDRYLFGVDRPDGKAQGTILRSRDGGASWRAESIPALERIAGMWGSGANDVYAVGSRGVVLHSTGDGWTTVRSATSGSLEGIWGENTKSIYAVGANGAIVHSSDGKTWTPRASGVRYTLSSIVGAGGEILVGSADGPPLRSTDGVSWRPMTAMISRGDVWAEDREHVVVAASTGVQFLGDSAPTTPVPLPSTSGIQQIKAQARAYASKYRGLRDLMLVAANQLGDRDPLPESLREPGLARFHIAKVSGCSSKLDTVAAPSPSGDSIEIELTCQQSCAQTQTPTIRQTATIWIDGQSKREVVVFLDAEPGWCSSRKVNIARDAATSAFNSELEGRLREALSIAADDDARANASATYVLSGGPSPMVRADLAKLVGQPPTWRGFFWNAPVLPSSLPLSNAICSAPAQVATIESQGEALMNQASWGAALEKFTLIIACKPSLASKGYLSACHARNFPMAKAYFLLIGVSVDALAQICMKEGFDPRIP